MKKVLFTATVDSHIKHFHIPYLKLFKENGYEVHVATSGQDEITYCDKKHVISFERSPIKINNLKAIKQLRKIVEKEKFDIIHCHTPMGGVVTRLAAKKARKKYGIRVIYTAHGFHFFKGAPLINWLIYYPIEKWLAKYTDTLITINQEDYELAKRKFGKRCRNIELVHGVGLDTLKLEKNLSEQEKNEKRKELGINKEDVVCSYVAELNKNKNQILLINTIKELKKDIHNIKLLLVGNGPLYNKYQNIIKENSLEENIKLLGRRNDINEILSITDIYLASSLREGLPVNIMEAMYKGIPVIATDNRGHRELIKNEINGYIANNQEEFYNKIKQFANGEKEKNSSFKENIFENLKQFQIKNVNDEMKKIYFRKKRILHLLSSNRYSGAENVACTIINNLSKDYDFFYCSPNGEIAETLKEKGIKYIPIKKVLPIYIKQIVKENNIDIIHAHDIRAGIMSSYVNVKIISHIHCNPIAMQKRTIKSYLYNLRTKKFAHIFWVSTSSYEDYFYKERCKKISSILINVIDKNMLISKANEDSNSYNYDVIYLGRLSYEKNPERLIDIIKGLVQKKDKIKVAIVGNGPLFENVKKMIINNKLQKNIKVLGFMNNPYKILSSSKIMIMTSRTEGTPMVALEAMALGIPIVSTQAGEMKDIVINDYNGYIFEKNNKACQIINMILENEKLQSKLRENSIKRFEKLNDIKKYMNNIESYYDS